MAKRVVGIRRGLATRLQPSFMSQLGAALLLAAKRFSILLSTSSAMASAMVNKHSIQPVAFQTKEERTTS